MKSITSWLSVEALSKCSDVVGEKWNPNILVKLPVTNIPLFISCKVKTERGMSKLVGSYRDADG
jgi:hypothetical protein